MGSAVQNRDWLGQSALHFRERLILAKPDPALGYFNSELRLWLGWAQDTQQTMRMNPAASSHSSECVHRMRMLSATAWAISPNGGAASSRARRTLS
jgi:hypothetical protein